MTEARLREILGGIANISVGIIGDFCLDAYWKLDISAPEISIETGKQTRAIRQQRYSLGGAGNIGSNVSALCAKVVRAFGVIGNDLFGQEMLRLFAQHSIHPHGILVQADKFDTPVYAKPILGKEEQQRFDFGRFNSFADGTVQQLTNALRESLNSLDVLIINQQLLNGVCSTQMIQRLNEFVLEFPEKILIADSRHRAHLIHHMIRKLNAAEALAESPEASLHTRITEIAAATHHPVFVTRGEKGILACDGSAVYDVPGIRLAGEIDSVGAGDTTVAAIACALAAGGTVQEAAEIGNLAAAVTVQKLRQTGTASPKEITALFLRH